jgi:collagenase-like PrtC family protease
LLDWLINIGTDSVTISLPYLAEIIAKNYRTLKIKVSTMAHVDSVEKAKFWESLGVNSITLLHTKVNRDFELLKQMRKNVKCKLQLMANNHCLYNCTLEEYHELFASHASQAKYPGGYFIFDYCYLTCRYKKLSNPALLISAPWIRPEDTHLYEQIGIDSLKIVDRRLGSKELITIIKAYLDGRYNGNLAELFPNLGGPSLENFSNILLKTKYALHPLQANLFMIPKMRSLLRKMDIFIDNRSLDGFIDFFLTHNCRLTSCEECGYCQKIAEKTVKIDRDYRDKLCKKYNEFFKQFLNKHV